MVAAEMFTSCSGTMVLRWGQVRHQATPRASFHSAVQAWCTMRYALHWQEPQFNSFCYVLLGGRRRPLGAVLLSCPMGYCLPSTPRDSIVVLVRWRPSESSSFMSQWCHAAPVILQWTEYRRISPTADKSSSYSIRIFSLSLWALERSSEPSRYPGYVLDVTQYQSELSGNLV